MSYDLRKTRSLTRRPVMCLDWRGGSWRSVLKRPVRGRGAAERGSVGEGQGKGKGEKEKKGGREKGGTKQTKQTSGRQTNKQNLK